VPLTTSAGNSVTDPTTGRRGDALAIQQRTLRLLFFVQVIGGVGFAVGASVGALLAAEMAGVGVSGLAQSAAVVGAALFAIPMTAIVRERGRRPSLAAGYGIAAVGALVVVVGARLGSIPSLFAGFFLFGGAAAAALQARYAALDLAPVAQRGRHLSIVVWATTIGAVIGPNLAPLAGTLLDRFDIPVLAAPYVFSSLLLGMASLALLVLLRPDPMVVARELRVHSAVDGVARATSDAGMRAALRDVLARPHARLGVTAMAIGHLVMIAVMAMTPVHIREAGHDAAHTLRIVGIVISLHIAGMYALAPLTGWLTDRLGRLPVIFAGIMLLLVACALAGTAGHDSVRLAIALVVLGMGWSCTMVAGSTMLTESVPDEMRASAQGLSDMTMGLAGASAGALSGVVVSAWGYPVLAVLAAIATLPLIGESIRFRRNSRAPSASANPI
jgi:MFS family permease